MNLKFENILLNVSKSEVIDTGDLQQAARLIIESILAGLEIKRCGIWLTNDDVTAIECKLLIDTYHETEIEELKLYRKDFPTYFKFLDTERSIVAVNAETDSATAEFKDVYLIPHKIRSMLDMPIRHKGKMIGIICAENIGEIKHWTSAEITFASAVSDLYGRAITANERNQYQAKLEEQNKNLEEIVQARTEELEASFEHLKQTQSKLIEIEKMASLGNLVAGVAHEVNTPISVAITGTTYNVEALRELEDLLDTGKLTKEKLLRQIKILKDSDELIFQNLNRAVDLIQNFKRTAADQSTQQKVQFDVGSYITNTLSSLLPMLRSHQVKLDTSVQEGVILNASPGILAQIITILVQNACYHAFTSHHTNKQLSIELTLANSFCTLAVKDNGQGIKQENQQRIFEPFFTTNRFGGGTGLGLSILYNLVTQQLNGEVQLISTEGMGCEFKIQLPNVTIKTAKKEATPDKA